MSASKTLWVPCIVLFPLLLASSCGDSRNIYLDAGSDGTPPVVDSQVGGEHIDRDLFITPDGPIIFSDTTPLPDTQTWQDAPQPPDAYVWPDIPQGDAYVWPDAFVWPDMPAWDAFVWPDMPQWDAFVWPDAFVLPDGPQTCQPFTGIIGKACTAGSCPAGYQCLLITSTSGICTISCTPDDPNTPLVNEDSCPNQTKNICGEIDSYGNYCFAKCNPQIGCNECDTGTACHLSSGAYVGLHYNAVCLFPGCTTNSDCPVTTGQACTTTLNSCPSGETCQAVSQGTTDGICAKDGVCDPISGLCTAHGLGKPTAKVGDPCKGDVDCGNNMLCLTEYDESKYLKQGGDSCTDNDECCSGICLMGTCSQGVCAVHYRNGYCTVYGCKFAATLPTRACPSGSDCNLLYSGGICLKTCDMTNAASCRNNSADYLGDYECRAWNNVPYASGTSITKGPVCDFGSAVPCVTWWSSGQDCSILGNTGNTTNMACRDLKNNVLGNKYDPSGFCLDNTASGPVMP
jgi:hypothetical protein